VNADVLGPALLMWLLVPLVCCVASMGYLLSLLRRHEGNWVLAEVISSTRSLVQMEDYMGRLAKLGRFERAHGLVHITSMERDQLLKALDCLASEAAVDPMSRSSGRLWQREAWAKIAQDKPDPATEYIIGSRIHGWCRKVRPDEETTCVFGDANRILLQDFVVAVQQRGLSQEEAQYLGRLVDIYEAGFVHREAFHTYVQEVAKCVDHEPATPPANSNALVPEKMPAEVDVYNPHALAPEKMPAEEDIYNPHVMEIEGSVCV